MLTLDNAKIAIIGLGYVGLPLAVEFGKNCLTTGFDIDANRIDELRAGDDRTLETTAVDLVEATQLSFTDDLENLRECNIYIVTVPTPIDEHNQPDLTPLRRASDSIGKIISKGDVVIYESTVYPGATEDECIPIIEEVSGLTFNRDFFAGYSPERINPGDSTHRLPTIKKVTSGSTPEVADFVDDLYKLIITAGTHKAPSIKVAEAAKVIENTQRDVNIALINELALIFEKLNIDTSAVLEAAGTKWNFLPFKPGLVGGHCIGVDPYYLTYKAQSVGYIPEIVLAGRRINDGMGAYAANRLIRELINRDLAVKGTNILIMGLTFKENCPDTRNTRVTDIARELASFGCKVNIIDPWVGANSDCNLHGAELITSHDGTLYDAVILAVAHDEFREMGEEEIRKLGTGKCVIFDLKNILPKDAADLRL